MNKLFATRTVPVAASASEVFALVSDPVAMAGFAEEAERARWLDGATRAVHGARFEGFNRNGRHRWRTTCEVVALEPERTFAYHVSATPLRIPISRWQYDVTPAADGTCTVTESNWARIPVWFIPVALLVSGVFNRPARNAANIAITLNRLKAHFEDRTSDTRRT